MRSWLAALLMLAAAPSLALEPGRQAVGFHGGGALPGGSLDDRAGFGFSVGGSYRQQLTPRLSGQLDGEFLRFGAHHIPGDVRTDADAFSVGASARWDFPAPARFYVPFFFAGGAISRVTRHTESPAVKEDVSDWKPGLLLGVGSELALNDQLSVGLSGRFRTFGSLGWAMTGGLHLSFALAAPTPRAATPSAAPSPPTK